MAQKPAIPKGTRDFGPQEIQKRQYIINVFKDAFERYGYQPIETPSFENLNTLTGKYGDEGDQLIFRILRRGDFPTKANDQDWAEKNAGKLAGQIADKALRYDLTVPFARFVVQHQNELEFPFKRYQIQPVWRGDRPQKGRFQEFFQCDADVVGSKSLWQEVEFVQLYDEVFKTLDLPVIIRMNNRKVLSGITEALGIADRFTEFTVILDKLDKIGVDAVLEEFVQRDFPKQAIEQLDSLLRDHTDYKETISRLEGVLNNSETGKAGLEEIRFVFEQCAELGVRSHLSFDLTLARGLNYYTGLIFEVNSLTVDMGSIGGGGRYDDLTGIFGLKNMSGIGISFGLDRIFICLDELGLFPSTASSGLRVLFLNFGKKESAEAMKIISKLRHQGISCELYPDSAKMKKQFDYAAKKGAEYVAFLGSEEISKRLVTLKNQASGKQEHVAFDELGAYFS